MCSVLKRTDLWNQHPTSPPLGLVAGVAGFVVIMSSCFGQTPNAGNIDSNRLWEIEQLVVDLPNDSIGALVGMPEEEQLKWKAKSVARQQERAARIASEPGLGPYLVALADRYVAEPGRDGLPMIFRAMSVRNDVPEQDLKRYFAHANAIITGTASSVQPLADDFLIGTASVMAAHPTPANEEMLLKMLDLRNDFTGVGIKLAAGEALATSGSRRALAPMEKTVKWFVDFAKKTGSGANQNHPDEVLFRSYIARFRTRITPTATTTQPQKAQPQPSDLTAIETPPTQIDSIDSTLWLIVALMAPAAAGLLWLLFRGGRK
jgi:hypothetical protein